MNQGSTLGRWKPWEELIWPSKAPRNGQRYMDAPRARNNQSRQKLMDRVIAIIIIVIVGPETRGRLSTVW